MSLRYLLDTNILSEPLAAVPNPAVLARLRRHQREIAIAAPVWHELVFGCRRLPESEKRRMIERYLKEVILASLPVLPYDTAAATWHGEERARLSKLGKTAPFVDGQIAAIAKINDLILVSRNLGDFRGFFGIRLENWFTSSRPATQR